MSAHTTAALTIDRRLAIELLHEAQIAAPESIAGVVLMESGEPCAYQSQASHVAANSAQPVWATVHSQPKAPAIPSPSQLGEGQLTLMISLTTKGVLQLRAWTLHQGVTVERNISIKD
jgi:hypothetical protein